jgi:hypothetical protein
MYKNEHVHLLFTDISVAHADEEERAIVESRQREVQEHQRT